MKLMLRLKKVEVLSKTEKGNQRLMKYIKRDERKVLGRSGGLQGKREEEEGKSVVSKLETWNRYSQGTYNLLRERGRCIRKSCCFFS